MTNPSSLQWAEVQKGKALSGFGVHSFGALGFEK
jgi:hypothetical protein